jgi:hypothetical protein
MKLCREEARESVGGYLLLCSSVESKFCLCCVCGRLQSSCLLHFRIVWSPGRLRRASLLTFC